MKFTHKITISSFILLIVVGNVIAAPIEKPSSDERCPVCGMYVAKYTNWIAAVVFNDGKKFYFDGPKDMFRFYFNVPKYEHDKSQKDIKALYVTDYYTAEFIDAEKAFFVVGSDVSGPMGMEFVPFATQEKAQTFKDDHKGKRIIAFEKIEQKHVDRMSMKHGKMRQ